MFAKSRKADPTRTVENAATAPVRLASLKPAAGSNSKKTAKKTKAKSKAGVVPTKSGETYAEKRKRWAKGQYTAAEVAAYKKRIKRKRGKRRSKKRRRRKR